MHWNPLDKRRKISTAKYPNCQRRRTSPHPARTWRIPRSIAHKKMTPLITIVKPHKIIIIWNKCIFPPSHLPGGRNWQSRDFLHARPKQRVEGSVQKLEIKLAVYEFFMFREREIANFLFAKGNAILNGKLCRHERAFKTKRLWRKIIVFDASVEVNRYLLRSRSWLWLFGGRKCGDEQGGR
jgi:hypothetical protein